MNREIKFRAWDGIRMTTNGIMFNSSTGCIETPKTSSFNPTSGEKDYFKVMQYTGLKDKNGKEIYEGDLVKWSDKYDDLTEGEEVIAKVKWLENDTLGWHFGKLRKLTVDKLWCDLVPDTMEVIGNIYENPELC